MGAEGGGSYAALMAAFWVPLWTCKNTCRKRANLKSSLSGAKDCISSKTNTCAAKQQHKMYAQINNCATRPASGAPKLTLAQRSQRSFVSA
jgi:hypothetical protein